MSVLEKPRMSAKVRTSLAKGLVGIRSVSKGKAYFDYINNMLQIYYVFGETLSRRTQIIIIYIILLS